MSDGIKLEVHDHKTGVRRTEEADLPIEIGKSPGGPNRIILAADRQTISRSHGRLERHGADLTYIDTSSNGTTVGGQLIKGGQCRVDAGDLITIEDYAIRIVGQEAVTLKLTDAKLAQLSDIRVATDESCVVVGDGGSLSFRKGDADNGVSDAAILELSFDGAAFTVDSNLDADAPEILINNRAVNLPARASPGDVLLVGQDRIEVLRGGQEKIVCGNPSCHLLNDLPFEENCVWCGYYLAASGSFTRVTPA